MERLDQFFFAWLFSQLLVSCKCVWDASSGPFNFGNNLEVEGFVKVGQFSVCRPSLVALGGGFEICVGSGMVDEPVVAERLS